MIKPGFLRFIRIPTGVDLTSHVGNGFSVPKFFGLCAVMCGLLINGPVRSASLDTALGLLLLEHPMIHAAEKRLISSNYEIDKAYAGFYPIVSFTGDAGPQYIDSPETQATGKDYSRNKQVATLTVTQM